MQVIPRRRGGADRARRVRRSARRGRAVAGAGDRASLSRSRAAAGARPLRGLLPPLQPAAAGRAGRRRHQRAASSRQALDVHPAHAADSRRADLGRRSADAVDGQAGVDRRRACARSSTSTSSASARACRCALPMRVDDELCAMLRKYHPLYINTHFNHPKELTPEARAACEKLADAGIPLGNQTVLLRGVNSDARASSSELNRAAPEDARASRTTCSRAIRCRGPITCARRSRPASRSWSSCAGASPAWAIPQLVIDAPGGGGKIPIGPELRCSRGATDKLTLRNYENKIVDVRRAARARLHMLVRRRLVGDCASDPPLAATQRVLGAARADDVVYGLGAVALARGDRTMALAVADAEARAALRPRSSASARRWSWSTCRTRGRRSMRAPMTR